MWFLVKAAFWISIVLVLIPAPPESQAPEVRATETIGAIATAMQDARGFCTRQPEACAAGGAAIQSFGERASQGAKVLQGFISERLEENRNLTPPPAAGRQSPTPAQPAQPAQPATRIAHPARETLTERDRSAQPLHGRS